MHDVDPRMYTTVIREMIRHENDVTNHRIMWLLIGQGLIANAYVSAGKNADNYVTVLAPMGILLTLSTFVILYKSYQARGYLQFLGDEAKSGRLREQDLPMAGWPPARIKGWRGKVWLSPLLGKVSDLLEPYLFLPALLILAWLYVLMERHLTLPKGMLLLLSVLLVVVLLFALCYTWVAAQNKAEQETNQQADNAEVRPPLSAPSTQISYPSAERSAESTNNTKLNI
jgi:hypothetical protein